MLLKLWNIFEQLFQICRELHESYFQQILQSRWFSHEFFDHSQQGCSFIRNISPYADYFDLAIKAVAGFMHWFSCCILIDAPGREVEREKFLQKWVSTRNDVIGRKDDAYRKIRGGEQCHVMRRRQRILSKNASTICDSGLPRIYDSIYSLRTKDAACLFEVFVKYGIISSIVIHWYEHRIIYWWRREVKHHAFKTLWTLCFLNIDLRFSDRSENIPAYIVLRLTLKLHVRWYLHQ